ncbi:MAG: DUF4367 domain-containing protein [Faecousia sp.]
MDKLIRKARRQEWHRRNQKTLRRLAAVFAVVILTGSVLVTQVDAVRVPVMNFFITVREEFSEIGIFQPEKQTSLSEKYDVYLPAYVPDGFVTESVEEGKNYITVRYSKDDESGDFYTLRFSSETLNGAYDTEDAEVTEITIQGYPAVLIEKMIGEDEYTQLIWAIPGGQYHITGYINGEEAVCILESVEKFF